MNTSIEIKTNLTKIILIFLIIIFTNGVKSEELKTNCMLKFDSLVCMDYYLTNNVKVNLQDNPYRIIIDFKKSVKFTNQSKINQSKNILFKDIRLNSNLKAGTRLVLELSQPAIISNFFFNKVKNNNKIINFEITLTKTSMTSFSIAKHVLSKNKGKFLSLIDEINLIESDKQISLDQRKFSNFPIQIDDNVKNLKSKKNLLSS